MLQEDERTHVSCDMSGSFFLGVSECDESVSVESLAPVVSGSRMVLPMEISIDGLHDLNVSSENVTHSADALMEGDTTPYAQSPIGNVFITPSPDVVENKCNQLPWSPLQDDYVNHQDNYDNDQDDYVNDELLTHMAMAAAGPQYHSNRGRQLFDRTTDRSVSGEMDDNPLPMNYEQHDSRESSVSSEWADDPLPFLVPAIEEHHAERPAEQNDLSEDDLSEEESPLEEHHAEPPAEQNDLSEDDLSEEESPPVVHRNRGGDETEVWFECDVFSVDEENPRDPDYVDEESDHLLPEQEHSLERLSGLEVEAAGLLEGLVEHECLDGVLDFPPPLATSSNDLLSSLLCTLDVDSLSFLAKKSSDLIEVIGSAGTVEYHTENSCCLLCF